MGFPPLPPWNPSLSSQVQEEKSHQFERTCIGTSSWILNTYVRTGWEVFLLSLIKLASEVYFQAKTIKMSESSAPWSIFTLRVVSLLKKMCRLPLSTLHHHLKFSLGWLKTYNYNIILSIFSSKKKYAVYVVYGVGLLAYLLRLLCQHV